MKREKCILLYLVHSVHFLDYGKKINTGVNKYFLDHDGLRLSLLSRQGLTMQLWKGCPLLCTSITSVSEETSKGQDANEKSRHGGREASMSGHGAAPSPETWLSRPSATPPPSSWMCGVKYCVQIEGNH